MGLRARGVALCEVANVAKTATPNQSCRRHMRGPTETIYTEHTCAHERAQLPRITAALYEAPESSAFIGISKPFFSLIATVYHVDKVSMPSQVISRELGVK